METIRVAEQLDKRAEKFTKFTPRASTSRAVQNSEKELLPTTKDREPATDLATDSKGVKTGIFDPSLSLIKCYRCNEMGHKSNNFPKGRELRLVEVKAKN